MGSPELIIDPPLLNSATPWATDITHLRAILASPSTGAATTRTSMLNGFDHQHAQHQYLFFDPGLNKADKGTSSTAELPVGASSSSSASASLNNLGYSPISLDGYLEFLHEIARESPHLRKTIIVSVTGTPGDIEACYARIADAAKRLPFPLAMEVNLSCPNIQGASPPAYDSTALQEYLGKLPQNPEVPVGLKTPPYTHHEQFVNLAETMVLAGHSVSFITATNTLGSCLVLGDDLNAQLPRSGIGGMAGPPLHPIALGNVSQLRTALDKCGFKRVKIIGVGGVSDGQGYRRMRTVGAYAVAVGTALGKQGPAVFERIEQGIKSEWEI